MKIKLLLFIFILFWLTGYSQVGIGTSLPNNSSQLDIVATNKGILISRVQLESTTSLSPITNSGTLPASLLVFNEATAGTAPTNVSPGYYYWLNDKWNRIIISSDVATQAGTVTYNPVTEVFSYYDQNGNSQIINIQDIIKGSETVTTLVNNPDGTHIYTSENNTTTTIDVVGDVTTHAATIFSNTDVINAVSPIVKGNETL